MQGLVIETSTDKCAILVAKEKKVLKGKFLLGGPELSKTVAKEVNSIVEGESIDFILVGQGPGSYTGIRVGASLAKGLSIGWGIPLFGFCSLRAFTPNVEGPFAIVVDARMGGLYTLFGTREKEGIEWRAPQLLKLADAPLLLSTIPYLTTAHPPLLEKKLPNFAWHEASIDLDLLAEKAFSSDFQTPFELSYLSNP